MYRLLHKFNLSTVTSISKTRTMNTNKCFIRYVEEENRIDISFFLNIKKTSRQFNFSRNPSENLQTLFARMATNIQKVMNKSNKKKCVNNHSEIEIKMYDIRNESIPNTYTCKELFNIPGPIKIIINEDIYEAVFNAPWVTNVNLPHSILAGFPAYPEYFKSMFTDNKKSTFKWYKGSIINDKGGVTSDLHVKWQLVAENFTYTPDILDIGMKLKLECIPGKYLQNIKPKQLIC